MRSASRSCVRLNMRIDDDDRIALLGANGNGKSRCVKLLSGRVGPDVGADHPPPTSSRSLIQRRTRLDELALRTAPTTTCAVCSRSARSEGARTCRRHRVSGRQGGHPAGRLSGGDRARLLLGLAPSAAHISSSSTSRPIISTSTAARPIISGINTYPGAVILVSHDRYLIEACADRLWLVAGGQVAPFEGDLDEYRDLVLASAAMPPNPNSPPLAGDGKGGGDRKGADAPRPGVSKTRALRRSRALPAAGQEAATRTRTSTTPEAATRFAE